MTLELKGDVVHKHVSAIRAFPLTDRDHFIVLKDTDGKELGIVRNLSDLEPKSQRLLAGELDRAYFTPRILQVNAIEEQFHVPKWDVETDRGPRVFEIRSLGAGRILIRDADGNCYEIPDYRKLDPLGRALVEGQI